MSEAVRYRSPPLCWAVTAQDFERWLQQAPPGTTLLWALGEVQPAAGHPTRDVVDEARKAGFIQTHHQRQDNGAMGYLARRVRSSAPVPGHALGESGAEAGAALSDDEVACLKLLTALAASGSPCPSNAALSRRLGLKNRFRAKYILAKLAACGAIVIRRAEPDGERFVTVTGSGLSTGKGSRHGG